MPEEIKLTKKYYWIDTKNPELPDMSVDICPVCDGDSDSLDDLFYCGTCQGRGWIYGQQEESVYLDASQIEQWNKEYEEFTGNEDIDDER